MIQEKLKKFGKKGIAIYVAWVVVKWSLILYFGIEWIE